MLLARRLKEKMEVKWSVSILLHHLLVLQMKECTSLEIIQLERAVRPAVRVVSVSDGAPPMGV